jgi:hypothetical protein
MNKTKLKLKSLKEETNLLESKNSFLNSKLWQLRMSNHLTKNNRKTPDNLFSSDLNDDIFDEIL